MRNNAALAEKSICDSPLRVGRKMLYPEKREAAFREGTLARIRSVLREGEDMTDFYREAVEREITRRKKP